MMKYKAYIAVFYACICGVILLSASYAFAQGKLKPATTEDVAIAFYKTGKIVPNFEKWVKKREPYIHTPWALRDKIYEKELLRLRIAYSAFKPAEDLLTVGTKTDVKLSRTGNEEDGHKYFLNAEFVAAPEAVYFPYDFLKERIVLMPYTIEKFMRLEITRGDYEYIRRNKLTRKHSFSIFRMKAHEADITQPYKIDGQEQWVLKTKVQSVEYWSHDGNLIFEYSRPDFVTPNTLDLQDLYNEKNRNEGGLPIQKGIVKSVPEFVAPKKGNR